jgi:hypothetical protein
MSLSARDAAKARRNAQDARKAYRSAAHFWDQAPLSQDLNREIEERIKNLAPLIAKFP